MKLLWLASWYPNRTSPYNGDFVMRHARALAERLPGLTVLTVQKDEGMPAGQYTVERQQEENVDTIRVYYGPAPGWMPEKGYSLIRSFFLQRKIYRQWRRQHGPPGLLHVHVPLKAGLLALWLHLVHRIPYCVSEHWAGYDPASGPAADRMPFLQRWLQALIFRRASRVVAVSEVLARQLSRRYGLSSVAVIPNVADTQIFYPAPRAAAPLLRLIHVSGMDDQKNVNGMLEALRIWKARGGRFRLCCYGRRTPEVQERVMQLGLAQEVELAGEAPQPVIADAMRAADALILYSRFETFGCVLIEAQCCGIPVIVSDLPVFHEIVEAGFSGVFVRGEDPDALADTLARFSNQPGSWDAGAIARRARERYSYAAVAPQFMEMYQNILSS